METRVSTPVRAVALAGLVVAAAGGGVLMLHRAPAQPQSATTPPPKTVARTPAPAPAPAPAKPAARPATPTRITATPPAHLAKPVARGRLVDARLPAQLQWALSQHRIVVVSFYDPQSDVDSISVAEAHQGAVDAKVGFLLVNVLDNAVAGPLTALLPGGGLLPDPGVLVYRAPGRVVYRFDGFADRDTVAQAAADAKAGQVAADVSDPGLEAASTTAP